MKKNFSILAVVIIFIAISCSDDDSINKNNGNNIIDFYNSDEPLKSHHDFQSMRVGTEWEYSYFSENKLNILVNKVQSIEVVGGDSVFNIYDYKDSVYYNGPIKYVKKIDGLYIYRDYMDSMLLLYKYPISFDEKYLYFTSYVEVKSLDTLIEVPFGKLKCIHYYFTIANSNDSYYQYNYFVSKRIGLVRQTVNYYDLRVDSLYLYYENNLVNYKY